MDTLTSLDGFRATAYAALVAAAGRLVGVGRHAAHGWVGLLTAAARVYSHSISAGGAACTTRDRYVDVIRWLVTIVVGTQGRVDHCVVDAPHAERIRG